MKVRVIAVSCGTALPNFRVSVARSGCWRWAVMRTGLPAVAVGFLVAAAAWRPHLVHALNSLDGMASERQTSHPWRIHLWEVTRSDDSLVFRVGIYRCTSARPPMNAYEDVMEYRVVRRAEGWVLAEQRELIHMDGGCGLQH